MTTPPNKKPFPPQQDPNKPKPPPPPAQQAPPPKPPAQQQTPPQQQAAPPKPPANNQPDPVEKDDPDNPNAPSQNEYDAASGNTGNTMNPLEDQGGMIQDQIGQEEHPNTVASMSNVMSLRDKVNGLLDKVEPAARDSMVGAIRHLSDAARQGEFGQHEGTAVSLGHAADALGRASQSSSDPSMAKKLDGHAKEALSHGGKILAAGRPPWNPLPTKGWRKGLPIIDI